MDVRLSAEQAALRDAARSLVTRHAAASVRELDDAERAGKLEAALDATGWRELRAAADGGAPWASMVEPALVAEELGRGLVDAAFIGPTVAADLRRVAGLLPATSPQTVAVAADLRELAISAGGHVPDAVAIDAAGSASALVLVADGDGHRLSEIPLDSSGNSGVDLTRDFRSVPRDAEVTPLELVNPLSHSQLERVTAGALALACADLVGLMAGAIRLGCAHVTTRQQYGVPVGSFQAVQHLLADAHVAMEGSRSVARHAAWAVDALDSDSALAAGALAKAYCARSARSVCEAVVQVHGGIGNTWECLAHVYLRRALVSADLFGGVGPSLRRVLDRRLAAVGPGIDP